LILTNEIRVIGHRGCVATAHLIHGFVGAGKTTFAKGLAAETGAIRFSMDEWYLRLYTGGEPTEAQEPELLRRVAAMLDDLWPQLLERGLDVVLDFGFWSRESRDAARRRAVEAGGRAVVYLLECDDESTRRRIDQRNEDPGRSFHLSSESIDFLRTRFEPLHEDELPPAIKPPKSP
jgi:predicted kinase